MAVWLLRLVTLGLAYVVALFAFIYSLINSKSYSEYSAWDSVWAWTSNILIVGGALVGWWFVQRGIARKLYGKEKKPNQ